MGNNIINAENVKISADLTHYINNHPILFFILAFIVIVGILSYWVFPKVIQVWKERNDKTDISKIKQDTTDILSLLREGKGKN